MSNFNHIDMRRRLNRLLYSPGIVDGGFEVAKVGDKRIKVGAGFAIDGNGRELLIITPQEKDVSGFDANASVYVALRYADIEEDKRTTQNISGFIRITERPEIRLTKALPSGNDVGIDIPIAKLQLDAGGNIQSTIDTSVRQLANLMVRGGKVGIGTTGPVATLDVSGKADTAGQVSLQLRSGNSAANYTSNQITLGYKNTAQYRHAIKTRHHSGQRSGNAIDFYVWKYLSASDKDDADTIGTLHTMTLDGGNVGIGTFSPGEKLDVNGTVKATKFTGEGAFVRGMILMWSGAIDQLPTGWALCDGKNGTPNLLDRFIVGAGSSKYKVGATGGEETVTLKIDHMPAHNHGGATQNVAAHSHNFEVREGNSYDVAAWGGNPGQSKGHGASTDNAGAHRHGINSEGGNQAHENRPPYFALAYIMKL